MTRDTVKHSALGWLRRLGWHYLTRPHPGSQPDADADAGDILPTQLRERLQAVRFRAQGQLWPLDESGVAQVLAALARVSLRRGVQEGNNALLRLLLDGIDVEQHLPDGQRVQACVQVIDWNHAERNCWHVVDAHGMGQAAREATPRVATLLGYVNGLPLVRVLCVERDAQGRWGCETAAIALHLQQRPGPAGAYAQLLLALDRRGGRYATQGAPAEHWTRWRERGWGREHLQRLRQERTMGSEREAPAADLRGVHASLLAGTMAPARVLALLHGFIDVAADGRRQIGRSAQFFAVQAALDQLHRRDARGQRCDGELRLAAGSGMRRVRHWLLQRLRCDPVLRQCRVLVMQSPRALPDRVAGPGAHVRSARRAPHAGLSPTQRLAMFMADGRGTTLHTSAATVQAWLRRRDTHSADDDLILLLDANLREGDCRWLQRARERMPRARWLWLASTPSPGITEGANAAAILYDYPATHAVADGVLAPVYHQALRASPAESSEVVEQGTTSNLRRDATVAMIGQHFFDTVQSTERGLRALLLVASDEDAQRYQRAFAHEGRLHSRVVPASAARAVDAHPGNDAQPQLLIAVEGVGLPSFDARMAVLYLDCALPTGAWAAALALVNRPHPDKRCAWLVDLRDPPCPVPNPDDWGLGRIQAIQAGLPRQHRRLHALLPAARSSDFHACRAHLAPRWVLDARGEARDLHRRRRRCLHGRVTAFGQQLQIAMLPAADGGAEPAKGSPRWGYQYDLHFCSMLRDAVNEDAHETHLYASEDVRIRHWARERAPQVEEPAWDFAALRAVDAIDAHQEADALHSQLRFQLDTDAVDPEVRRRTQHQLGALLFRSTTPARRLKRLRALQAMLETGSSGSLREAAPLLRACHALLARHWSATRERGQQHLRQTLAGQLVTAVIDVRAAHGHAPHLVAMALRRRLAHAWPAQFTPHHRDAVLADLPALLSRADLFETASLD